MDSVAFNLFVRWGFWILGIGIILAIIVVWCSDVSQKLSYIIDLLAKTAQENHQKSIENLNSVKSDIKRDHGKTISPVVAVCIIGGAIIVLFVIPILILNN